MITAPRPTVPKRVEAGRLALRPWDPDRPEDRSAVLEITRDPDGRLWNPIAAMPPEPSDDDARAWCRRQSDWEAGGGVAWAVVPAGDEAHVLGYVSIHLWDEEQAVAQTGYWVLPAARRRGVATLALAAAAGWVFGRHRLHRLELFHAVENDASCRTAERAGFAREGLHRLSHRFGDGEYHDEHTHARLAADPVTALEIAEGLPYAVRALDG